MITFRGGTFRNRAKQGQSIQKNVAVNSKDGVEVDKYVLVLLVSSLRRYQVFIGIFANVRIAFNAYHPSVHR